MFKLADIFVGKFQILQNYGERPEIYSARYSIRFHNGVDFSCPSLTLILSTADGIVFETGFDTGGYGNYVKILHEGFISLYAHLNDILVKKDEHVACGQLIGHSNNTGFSDTPHLHFGIAPANGNGDKTEDNGCGGYIDPMGSQCSWEIKGLSEPVIPQNEVKPSISVPPDELSIKTIRENNFLTIASFVSNNGAQSINVNSPDCGEKVNSFIAGLLQDKSEQITSSVEKPKPIPLFTKFKLLTKSFVFENNK